jgi:DMSO/TMAO reductase YedYZ molybdopterin-dependent catalytic subunit
MRRRVSTLDRRSFLCRAGVAAAGITAELTGLASSAHLAWAQAPAPANELLAGRPLVRYPQKTDLILLTSRPPQLETPMKYFETAITPNEAFYVRYHLNPPTEIDVAAWRLRIGGHVERPLELSLDELRNRFPSASVVAVNQCSGNSRGYFEPRVFGGQWAHGAMGNAQWTGARLRDILNAAGVREGSVDVSFAGLDQPPMPTVARFEKSLRVSRIMQDPDVLVAYSMNGQPLPFLNGFPARLVVPGWYGTYWVKHLSEITVLDREFDGFWMKERYLLPDTPCKCVEPGAQANSSVPTERMNVRSFIVVPEEGATVPMGRGMVLKGIAFDGGHGLETVMVSADNGLIWRRAVLGQDRGNYSFREWSYVWNPPRTGQHRLMVRAINRIGESQPFAPLWNPSGYVRNVAEHVNVTVE